MFPGDISTFRGITSPAYQNSPEESNPVSPGKLESISPSSKLIPSRFWKLIPRRARTRRPTLFKELFPQQDITGLSSAKSHGKVVVNVVLSYPQRSLFTLPIQQRYPQQSYYQHSARHHSSHRVLLSSMIARVSFLPAESSIRQVYSATESSSPTGILAVIIPSGSKIYSSTSAQDTTFRHSSRIHFPRQKHT